MRTRLFLVAALVGLLFLVQPVQAKGARFFEQVLIEGDAEDFANGALDLEAVFVAETYPYDADRDEGWDNVVFRLEPRALSEIQQCQVQTNSGYQVVCNVRYDLHFSVAGTAHHLYARLEPPQGDPCCAVVDSNAQVVFDTTSLKFLIERNSLGLFPGQTIETLYVTSQLIAGEQAQNGDRAPGDNQNRPYDQVPEIAEEYAPPHTLAGTYEFFTIEAVDGLQRDSVGGQGVEFNFKVAPTKGVKEDTLRFRFDLPEGWSVTPSRGTTGIEPKGLLTGISEGMVADFGFTASANDVVEQGDLAAILMRVHSSSQGYKLVPLTVRVTGSLIESPDYVFQWGQADPLRAGQANRIRLAIVDAEGAPRTGLPVEVLFAKDGKRAASVPAQADAEGYLVEYEFPSAGTWVLDARVANLQPSPHSMLTVEVSKAAGAPGPGPLALLAAVALGLALKGRLPSRP